MSAPKPSRAPRTVRERRGSMILTGVIIAVVLAFSAAVSLRDGIVPLWAFLGLTGGGIAAGLLLYAVKPAGLRWLLIALVVGLAVALRISAMPGAMAPWLLGVVAGSFLSRDEWPWRRSPEERQRERQPRPLARSGRGRDPVSWRRSPRCRSGGAARPRPACSSRRAG